MKTNKDVAAEVYAKHLPLASTDGKAFRKTVMAEIIALTGCSTAASATYYNNCKKAGPVVEGLGRAVVTKTPRKSDKFVPFEPEQADNDCFSVIELVNGENNIQVGRCQAFLMQGDASEKFDSKIEVWPNCTWVMIQGLGPLHGETYKLAEGEKEIKRYAPTPKVIA